MANFGRGSQRGIRYIAEATFGVTPTTPIMKAFRTTGDTLGLTKQTYQSSELRSDRQITDLRHGNSQVGGDISFELSYGAQDDFMESAMFGAWTPMYTLTGLSVTVAATGKTFTRSTGSWIADGVQVGDRIVTTGFATGANNGSFKVSAVTALVVTCSTATGLVDEGPKTGIGVTTTHCKLVTGTTLKTFAIERAHLDIGQYLLFNGMAASTFKLGVQPNGMVTGSFGFVGNALAGSAATVASSVTAAPTGSVFDGFTGAILEGGTAIAIVTGLDLALDNGITPAFALMDKNAKALIDKRSNLTGTLRAYFADLALLNKWIQEAGSTLAFTLTDLAGNNYKYTVPNVKYSGGDAPVSGEGEITLSMPFQAVCDPTTGTNFQIERIPA